MLQETDVDIFAFRNAHFQNAGDLLGLPMGVQVLNCSALAYLPEPALMDP
jgi:hypothetical protein